MVESAFQITTDSYDCPRCGATKGNLCRMPSGRITKTPHGERMKNLTQKDWDRCRGTSVTLNELFSKKGGENTYGKGRV